MVDKMDEAMKKEKKSAGIMVAGASHSEQIIPLLKQKGYNKIIYIEEPLANSLGI